MRKKIEKIELELQELDKEQVLKLAKIKANKIKKRTERLVKFATKKCEDTLKKEANELQNIALETTKKVVEKLETYKRD